MRTLDEALQGVSALAFDTSPFIYFIERHPLHLTVMRELFRRVDAGDIIGFSSVLTLTEVLTRPLQVGNHRLEREYRSLLEHSRHFTLVPVDEQIASHAALLRARYKLRTPDALHVASALQHGCQAFITNDRALGGIQELSVLLVEDLTT